MIFRIIGKEHLWENSTPEGELSEKFRIIGTSEEGMFELKKDSIFKAIDTETTGLKWMKNDDVFLMVISNDTGPMYCINFQDYSLFNHELWRNYESDWTNSDPSRFKVLFEKEQVWVGQNIKFDYHMLYKMEYPLIGTLKDTMVRERLLDNDKGSYSLENIIARTFSDLSKDDAVSNFIDKHGLYHVEIGSNGKPFKSKYFNLVPFDIMAKYAAMDVHITRELYLNQEARFADQPRSLKAVTELEEKITSVCCDMEQTGILINKPYCLEAAEYESKKISKAMSKFNELTGKDLIDSSECIAPMLIELGYNPPKTKESKDSIAGEFLETIDHDIARLVLEYREATKRLVTYFFGYLSAMDEDDCIHADMKQSGARTGRFSYMNPNLQNIPSEDGAKYPVRRAFIPRPGHLFVSIDYAQQEFRLLLNYANESGLIEKIKNGHDPHQATADITGLTRHAAKTLNFGLIYAMGIQTLAYKLKSTYEEAKHFKYRYFAAMPNVKNFIYEATDRAKQRGSVYTWLNRKLDFPNIDFSYKATNAIIQGGCADITKTAMVNIHKYFKDNNLKSRMLVQIHDEILFEVAVDELDCIEPVNALMSEAYEHRYLPLTTSISYSLESFYDMTEVGNVEEIKEAVKAAIGEGLQGKSKSVPGDPTQHMV